MVLKIVFYGLLCLAGLFYIIKCVRNKLAEKKSERKEINNNENER